MKNLLRGILITLIALAVGGWVFFKLGYIDFRADISPSWIESKYAVTAVDASTERHAPQVQNPIPPTEENLRAGARLYRDKCADCHGRPDNPESDLGRAFYPRVPQFVKDLPDMPENQNFYIVKHGIRWTGMPAWGYIMTDAEIWRVVTFLSHMQNLPPAVKEELHKPAQNVP